MMQFKRAFLALERERSASLNLKSVFVFENSLFKYVTEYNLSLF